MSKRHKILAVIPYLEGLSDAVARVCQGFGIFVAMRRHTTIMNLLVHPKDKVNVAECVYSILSKNYQKVYIGEANEILESG